MFLDFKKALQSQFANMLKTSPNLFYVDVDRDEVWDTYLSAFAEEDKQSNNCNCCKSFLRQYSGIVIINKDLKKVSIWDGIEVEDEYKASVEAIRKYIHSRPITNIFAPDTKKCGTDHNLDRVRNVTWNHFYLEVPKSYRADDIDSIKGKARTSKETLQRALSSITGEIVDTVLSLINSKVLYRGVENKHTVEKFKELVEKWENISLEEEDNFCWVYSQIVPASVSGIRNTSIGSLLVDLSGEMDLEKAVSRYEAMVAPSNYKRTTALVTPAMVKKAQEKIVELGLSDSLERRLANDSDLSIDDILFTNKVSGVTDVFEEMSKDVVVNPKSFIKSPEISVEDFIKDVLPSAKSLEVLVQDSHFNNFTTLVTAKHKESAGLFKWANNFSWSYTGGITDAIKERVKAAGGNVEGELRISLSWCNFDDLDLHVTLPNGGHIYYGAKVCYTSRGTLDVDANAGSHRSKTPVENIIFSNKERMIEGEYTVTVNNFALRSKADTGFTVQIECRDVVTDFTFDKSPRHGDNQQIVKFKYTKKDGIIFSNTIESKVSSKTKWGISTNKFTKVTKMMLSPNHWNGATGNKHYLFFLDKCITDEETKPFFNEFLKEELREDRKVFEILSDKMKVPHSDYQLSGLGFSETQRNQLIVKIDNNSKKIYKINF